MGWMETCAMDERMRFVMAAAENEEVVCGDVPAVRGEPEDRLQMACAL